AHARLDLALQLAQRRRCQEAQPLLEQMGSYRHSDVHIALAECSMSARDTAAALRHYEDALALRPGYPPAIFGMAKTYKARGDLTRALESYRRYVEARPRGSRADRARAEIERLESQLSASPAEAGPPPF